MKLTILGTSAAYSGKNEGCPSYLISAEGKHYLIEAGPGCVSSVQNFLQIHDISGVFLSHLHADHVSDIYTLRYAVYIAQNKGIMSAKLPIYMPKAPKKIFKFIRDTVKKEFKITEITEQLILDLNELKVSFLKTEHAILAFAMRFESGNKLLVYTSDTRYFNELVSFSKGADILLSEATFQNSERELETLGHMTSERAGELATRAGARTLVLTHIMPDYEKEISLEEGKNSFKGEILIAERGQEFTL
jgi:ribonuclease BN (tRNA processing enzyme)